MASERLEKLALRRDDAAKNWDRLVRLTDAAQEEVIRIKEVIAKLGR